MIEFPLENSGRALLEDVLASAEGAAKLLIPMLAQPGRIFAPLPETTSIQQLHRFEGGGLQSAKDGLNWLSDKIRGQLPGRLFFQDLWATERLLALEAPQFANYLIGEAGVYYYLDSDELSHESISEAYGQLISFQAIAFFVQQSGGVASLEQKQPTATIEYFRTIVPFVDMICASAYDNESWVVWERISLQ